MPQSLIPGDYALFAGTGNRPLAERIAEYVHQPLGDITLEEFGHGLNAELNVEYKDDIRGRNVVIIQPTNAPARNFMEAFMMVRAAMEASAGYITLVMPYFGYVRSDRKEDKRTPTAAKLMADLLVTAGVNHVLLLDLHSAGVMGFFDKSCRVDHLFAGPVFRSFIRQMGLPGFKNGGPDNGGSRTAQVYTRRLPGDRLFFATKGDDVERANEVIIHGSVAGDRCRIVDDETTSGTTLALASQALQDGGAAEIHALVTHGKFEDPEAVERIRGAPIDKLFITDSVDFPVDAVRASLGDRFVHVQVAPLIGEAIDRIHRGGSLLELKQDEAVAKFYRESYTV